MRGGDRRPTTPRPSATHPKQEEPGMPQRIDEIAPGLRNANQPLEGVATAGQPEEEHFGRLASAGYRTVIDLRGPGEDRGLDEPEVVRRAGMEYANVPVGHEDVDGETFERFRELIAEPGHRPVLVHCASANRVGALLIPYPRWYAPRWLRCRCLGGLQNPRSGGV